MFSRYKKNSAAKNWYKLAKNSPSSTNLDIDNQKTEPFIGTTWASFLELQRQNAENKTNKTDPLPPISSSDTLNTAKSVAPKKYKPRAKKNPPLKRKNKSVKKKNTKRLKDHL